MGFLSVILLAPMLAAFGLFAVFLLLTPFCVGFFFQLIFSIFARKAWMLLLMPGLGIAGLLCSLIWLGGDIPLPGILIYWGFYFLLLWLIWLAVFQIKKFAKDCVHRKSSK